MASGGGYSIDNVPIHRSPTPRNAIPTVIVTASGNLATMTVLAADGERIDSQLSLNDSNILTVYNTLGFTKFFHVVEVSTNSASQGQQSPKQVVVHVAEPADTIHTSKTILSFPIGTAKAYAGLGPQGWNSTASIRSHSTLTKASATGVTAIATPDSRPLNPRDGGEEWVVAVLNGEVVSWKNNYHPESIYFQSGKHS